MRLCLLSDRLETQELGLMRALVKKAGQLGLLGINIPECYGGLGLSKSVTTLLTEQAAVHPAFALSIGIHAGVATLPLILFGTQEQKQKYLPQLATGEMIGAFALSEANSGSDALAAECRAKLSPDDNITNSMERVLDHQCRFCRPVYGLCEGGRRAFYRLPGRAGFPGCFYWARRA